MPGSLTIARIFGIKVQVHSSWFLIAVLVLVTFQGGLPILWTEGQRWLAAGAMTLLFFLSVLAHELSHSLVARAFRLRVQSITLFVFGGVANLPREPESPRAEFLMAAVGPVMSFFLAGLFWVTGEAGDVLLAGRTRQVFVGVFSQIALVNLILGVFNLLPGFPLDGGRVLRSIIWGLGRDRRIATRVATLGGQLLAGALVLYGLLQLADESLIGGMWSILVAIFLYNAAVASYRQETFDDTLRQVDVGSLMTRDLHAVPSDLPIATLVATYVLPLRGRAFPVERAGETVGIVSVEDARRVPREQWPLTPVADVMSPVSSAQAVSPSDSAASGWSILARSGATHLPVIENGRLVGVLERQVLVDYLRMREELGLNSRRN